MSEYSEKIAAYARSLKHEEGADDVYEVPKPHLESYITGDSDEYVDGGLQETGERLILSKDGRSGFEVDPSVTLVNGKLVWS